jgi:hypothetical protein
MTDMTYTPTLPPLPMPVKALQVLEGRAWSDAELFCFLTLMRDVPWRVLGDRSILIDEHTLVRPGAWVVWHSGNNVEVRPDHQFQAWAASFAGDVVRFNEPAEEGLTTRRYATPDGEVVEAARMSPMVRKPYGYVVNTTLPYLLRRRGRWTVAHSARLVTLDLKRRGWPATTVKLGMRDWLARTASGLLHVYPDVAFRALFNVYVEPDIHPTEENR